jgi:integrase
MHLLGVYNIFIYLFILLKMSSSIILNTLRDASVSQRTMLKYKKCVAEFIQHSQQQLLNISLNDYDSLDSILSQYFEQLYAHRKSYSKAVCTLYGLCLLFPKLNDKRMLADARLRLKGWRRLQPSESYPPLTYEITCAIAIFMIFNGNVDEGIATLLSFDCYLRISEFVNLKISDIINSGSDFRSSRTTHNKLVLCLAQTKTGRNQSVIIRRPEIASLLLHFIQYKKDLSNTNSNTKLFSFSAASYRRIFKNACYKLRLGDIGYTPHSLRHGGATFDFQNSIPIADIKTRGRWKDTKSAERYIQTGVALLRLYHVPPAVFDIGCLVIDNLPKFVKIICSSFLQ